MGSEFQKQIVRSTLSSLLLPKPYASLIGGAVAYLGTSPAIPGLWGLAAAAVTGIATGYGASWGRPVCRLAGIVVGAGVGMITGSGLGAAFSESWEKSKNTLTGAGVGAVGGATLFAIAGSLVGPLVGGVFAYQTAKTSIDEWALSHVQSQNSSVEQVQSVQPVRVGQSTTIKNGGKTYNLVLQNG